jgi:hypothetical protein
MRMTDKYSFIVLGHHAPTRWCSLGQKPQDMLGLCLTCENYSRFHLRVQSKAGPLMECCDLAPLWYSGAAIRSLPGVLWEPSAATWRRFGSLAPPRLVAKDYQSGDKSPHSIPVHATEKRCNWVPGAIV